MRLLDRNGSGEFIFTKDFVSDDETPQYAILSHTWTEGQEVTFKDMKDGTSKSNAGYDKIRFCGQQAERDDLRYFWVDTCCIDKSNSVELQEAINSMFSWYQNAAKCYVYLSDVSATKRNVSDQCTWESDFRASRWFTRGWTLQELLAPISVEFFSREGVRLGNKRTLERLIHEITGIAVPAIRGIPLSQFEADERLFWAKGRQTTRKEDEAYSLLGIFDVYMPLIYGEGRDNALKRLREEIDKSLNNKRKAVSRIQRGSREQAGIREQRPTIDSSMEWLPDNLHSNPSKDSNQKFAIGFHLERVHIIPHFTPRREYMETLESLLPNVSAGRKVAVLYGLGGIGKTQLAIKFAKDHRAEFASILFLDGSSQESLFKSFALIHRRIIKSEKAQAQAQAQAPGTALSAGSIQTEREKVAEEVVQWLALDQNSRWLLIFDNVDREPSDEGGFNVVSYFPPKDHGSILITTRLAPLSRLGCAKRVSRMSREQAAGLLDQILGDVLGQGRSWAGYEDPATNELLATLDGLPLAISQAGRFINTLNLKPETYLELYNSSKREVIDMLSNDSVLHDAEKASIRTTWTTSLNLLKEKASKQGPDGNYYAAYRLLQLFAYFEPSDLNYDIIRFGVIGNNVPDWFRRTVNSKLKFFAVIKILLDLCLIDNNVAEGSYSMHRVVHDWLCTYVCGESNPELLRIAVAAISYSAPLIWAPEWREEQQQLALHALHIFPRLRDICPNDFLVRYDEMSAEELAMVASLLDEPVKCWTLMKFECTLVGISRLLQSCGCTQKGLELITEAKSRSPQILDGIPNPVYYLLHYAHISIPEASASVFSGFSELFYSLGSPSWAIKVGNLSALILAGTGSLQKAIEKWELVLDQSRSHTGSVFVHPTWMVFGNLSSRLRDDAARTLELLVKFEAEARRETDKPHLASFILSALAQLRGWEEG